MKKLRLLIAFGALATLGVFFAYKTLAGSGEVVVVGPLESNVTVALDEQSPLELKPSEHRTLQVAQGTHAVTLTRDGVAVRREIQVKNGFARLLVAAQNQCFAILDVTDSHYGSAAAPVVYRRQADPAFAMDVPGDTYFSEAELPKKLRRRQSSAYLAHQAPCAEVARSDKELLAFLGY